MGYFHGHKHIFSDADSCRDAQKTLVGYVENVDQKV